MCCCPDVFKCSSVRLDYTSCSLVNMFQVLRPLSTVGLLAFPRGSDQVGPPLWLLDGTGAYPVRAMCVGGGLDAKTGKPVAQIIQSRMRRRTDFADMSLEECLRTLLRLVSTTDDDSKNELSQPLLERGTRLEMAGAGGDGRRFTRIPFKRLSALEQS